MPFWTSSPFSSSTKVARTRSSKPAEPRGYSAVFGRSTDMKMSKALGLYLRQRLFGSCPVQRPGTSSSSHSRSASHRRRHHRRGGRRHGADGANGNRESAPFPSRVTGARGKAAAAAAAAPTTVDGLFDVLLADVAVPVPVGVRDKTFDELWAEWQLPRLDRDRRSGRGSRKLEIPKQEGDGDALGGKTMTCHELPEGVAHLRRSPLGGNPSC